MLPISIESIGHSVQEKKPKIGFKDYCHGGHLGFPIGTILAIFDLLMLATKFKSIGCSVQEMKQNIDFQGGGHFGFPIGTILAIFDLQVIPMLPTKF